MSTELENADKSSETNSTPSTHFQTVVLLEDKSEVGVIISKGLTGDLQFYLERQVDSGNFGPVQIVSLLLRLQDLTKTLENYVHDRISEAKASLEKDSDQLELPFEPKSDSTPALSETCESSCCGGCGDDQVPAQPSVTE